MIGWRCSTLPFSEKCGIAGELMSQQPETISMLEGSAYHAASCDDKKRFAELCQRLPESSIEALMLWKRLESIEIDGVTLRYEDAEKERPVAISVDGTFVARDPDTNEWPHDLILTAGTLDCGWIVQTARSKLAVVVDLKRSRYASEKDSLQLLTYGYAYAYENGCDEFAVAIYAAESAQLIWGPRVSMDMIDSTKLFERIKRAALNRGVATVGSHCQSCYVRTRCSAHLLPGAIAIESNQLAPFVEGGYKLMTPELAREWIDKLHAIEKLHDILKEHIKAYAKEQGGIPLEPGYVWTEVKSKPSSKINWRKMIHENGDLAEKYREETASTSKGFRRLRVYR